MALVGRMGIVKILGPSWASSAVRRHTDIEFMDGRDGRDVAAHIDDAIRDARAGYAVISMIHGVVMRTNDARPPGRASSEQPAIDRRPEDWRELAVCVQVGGDLWHPEKGGSTREAKKICLGCEVRAECLAYALAHDERFGIWGGLSEKERRPLRKQRQATPRPKRCRRGHDLAVHGTLADGRCGACNRNWYKERRLAQRFSPAHRVPKEKAFG